MVATPPVVEKVIESAFSEPDPERPRRTRALLVIHRGQTLAERYAPGYSAQSRFIGWSMSKSVMSALVGILVSQGRLTLEAPAPVPEWANPADPRHAITLDQLLHMSSGLEFDEDYHSPLSDVVWLLYGTGDGAAFAAGKPLAATPGTTFHYSSGTTEILSRIVAQRAGEPYPRFAARTLFEPLGMTGALIEPDATGTPMGACCVWATARDWARFGLLYLQEGVWEGRRILPVQWVDYSRTPAPAANEAQYGAHFWLKVPPPYRIEPGRPATAADGCLSCSRPWGAIRHRDPLSRAGGGATGARARPGSLGSRSVHPRSARGTGCGRYAPKLSVASLSAGR